MFKKLNPTPKSKKPMLINPTFFLNLTNMKMNVATTGIKRYKSEYLRCKPNMKLTKNKLKMLMVS